MKKRNERAQINKFRNEREGITTDTTEIQRIIRDYHKKWYTSKMDTLEEMDKFLEVYKLLRLNQEQLENMSRLISSNEIESVIKKKKKKNFQQTKVQDQIASQVNSTKHLKYSKLLK